jgi:hypothetical protein
MTWMAVFDWEHDKEVLLNNPKLYKIGLLDVYFNAWSFWRWFFYAIWQGSLLLLLSFLTLSTASSHRGENGSLYVEG